MAASNREEINCAKCGQFIFARTKQPDGNFIEDWPVLPITIRFGGPNALSQAICPSCGHVNQTFYPAQRTLVVSKIFSMPGIKTDNYGISEVGTLTENRMPVAPSTDALKPAAEAFKKNIERIEGLGTAPAFTTGLTYLLLSKYQEISQIHDDGLEAPPEPLIDAYLSQVALFKNLTPDERGKAMQVGKDQLRIWLNYRSEIQDGIGAIFSSQIVSLWTALETLMGDLWEASINIHPSKLGDLRGAAKRISRLSQGAGRKPVTEPLQTEDQSRSVLLADIRRVTKGTYNLDGHLGSLLREKFGFARLEGIREAYSVAFSVESDQIDKALADNSIDAISLARNVLVHSAGRADQEYFGRSKSVTSAPRLNIGDPFPLTGQVVYRLMKPAISTADELITAVDEWVAKH